VAGLRTDSDRVEEVLSGLCDLVDTSVIPLEERNAAALSDEMYRQDGRLSDVVVALKREVRMRSAAAGFYGMCVPTELDGGGQGPLLHLLAWERLHHRYGPNFSLPNDVLAHWARGPSHIFLETSPDVRENVLPDIMSGDKTICFSLSEPDAGSDSWSIRTTATRVDGGWQLTGTKQWSTNGATADYAVVFAVTDKEAKQRRKGGVTAFLVPTDSAGLRVDSTIRLFGERGGDEAIIFLDAVSVPDENVIGTVDRGFDLAMSGISLGRMFNAGRSIGMARWAMERATEYAKERVTFGNPISSYQGIQFLLADCATKIYASRAIALDCARRLEAGLPARKELAMVKAFTTESAFEVLDSCMQVFGGMGFTNELGLYKAWHAARISRVADGSGEIMRRTIAKRLLGGDVQF